MTDKLLDFGEATLGSSAASYCAKELDFGQGKTILSSTEQVKIQFIATAAVTGFTPAIYVGDATAPTTEVTLGASNVSLAVNEAVEYPLPMFEVKRFMRAGGKGTGKVIAKLVLGGSRN